MVKNNYKLVIGFVFGIILSCTGVYAASTIIKSKDVSYDKSTSGGKYDNVQDAIDELYEKSGLLKDIWVDKTLNGADPVLDVEGTTKKLIPITLDNDGTVHYANLKTKWYDYADKKWANAVILVDNPKNGGEENYTYKTGDIINENDIESYFVWIPRFSYKIWNLANTEEYNSAPKLTTKLDDNNILISPKNIINNTRIIDVKFGDVKINLKMNESEATLDNYYTHPAFTLGDKDLKGIWVSKFKAGYNQDGDNGQPLTIDNNWTKVGANQNKEASNRIIIKPNVYSWRDNNVQNIFLSSYNYERKLESHMMKNTEWGAVAYLSHSKYGIGTEVRLNNNSDFLTGYSAKATSIQNNCPGDYGDSASNKSEAYNTSIGYLASTTGNITGVYDMSGSPYEYVAAYKGGNLGASGFNDETLFTTGIYKNYVDIYPSDSGGTTYSKRILGDATGEMGPFYTYKDGWANDTQHNSWYSDQGVFINDEGSWFIRGGDFEFGSSSGQFAFHNRPGSVDWASGFRVVLSP